MSGTLKRELRVAFSKRCQPLWFRLAKWMVAVVGAVLFFRSSFFWYWMAGLLLIGLAVHFVYRWKTHAWTRPWGGWSDVEAGR